METKEAAGYLRELFGPIYISQEPHAIKKRGARWIARSIPNLGGLLAKVAEERIYLDSATLVYLKNAIWKTQPNVPVRVVIDEVPAYELWTPKVMGLKAKKCTWKEITTQLNISKPVAIQAWRFATYGVSSRQLEHQNLHIAVAVLLNEALVDARVRIAGGPVMGEAVVDDDHSFRRGVGDVSVIIIELLVAKPDKAQTRNARPHEAPRKGQEGSVRHADAHRPSVQHRAFTEAKDFAVGRPHDAPGTESWDAAPPNPLPRLKNLRNKALMADMFAVDVYPATRHRTGINVAYDNASVHWVDLRSIKTPLPTSASPAYNVVLLNDVANPQTGIWTELDGL